MADLATEYRTSMHALVRAVEDVLSAGAFILGDSVLLFESEMKRWLDTSRTVVGVNSGTDALVLSLTAAGIGPSHEVITTPFTFVATAEAICRVGAIPVFVDIDSATLNLSPEAVQARITQRTRAVLTVHLFGNPSGLPAIQGICERNGLHLIEDAAQAFGAVVGGVRAGTIGRFGAFSFFPTKNLGAAGDAGAVTCSEADSLVVRELRNHGSTDKGTFVRLGFNSRLDEIQAAVLVVRLAQFEARLARRRRVAEAYLEALAGLPVAAQKIDHDVVHAYNYFTIKCDHRDELRAYLSDAGVGTAIYYRVPLHLQPVFADLNYPAGQLPAAEVAARQVLSLPCHPEMTVDDAVAIAALVKGFF